MRIVLNLEPLDYSDKAKEIWQKNGFEYFDIDQFHESKNHKVEILIVRLGYFVNQDIIAPYTYLKQVVTAATGSDHIDFHALKKRNIYYTNLKDETDFLKSIPSTAEHTWALLLALLRNIPQSNQDVLMGNWNRDKFKGFELSGKKIGIVGLGRIGQKIAKYAEIFDMEIHYFDPFINSTENYKRHISLNEMIADVNILSLHVHLTQETDGLISKGVLSEIKKPIYIINTSRGRIVNEQAILDGIMDGRIKGYASDVLSDEVHGISKNPLIAKHLTGKIIITPHIGGATFDAMWKCEEFIANKICQKN